MIFNISNFTDMEQLYLHDAELQSISVGYKEKTVTIALVTASVQESQVRNVTLVFREVCDVNVPIHEPWGEGYYVFDVEADKNPNHANRFTTLITLNSGDVITVTGRELQVLGK